MQKFFLYINHTLLAFVLITGATILLPAQIRAETRTLIYNSVEDSLARYSFGLVEKSLERSRYTWKYEKVEGEISQARMIEMVKNRKLDIMWAATNQEMENTLLPVRIPLYKGLLGHRIFLIHEGNQARFDSIQTLDDIKELHLGQGTTWADTYILRHNGMNVITANKYESLFYMVDGGRFDAFPRGVQEPWSEMAARPDLELAVEKNIMLVYKMPFYLFVSKENGILGDELYSGLRAMIDDGSFHEYFINDPTVLDVVKKANIKNRKSFHLDNPTLPPETPIEDPDLWLDPTQL